MSWTVIEPACKPTLRVITRFVPGPALRIHMLVEGWKQRATTKLGHRYSRTIEAWCRMMHENVTWPLHGRYHCRRCHRSYAVPWDWKPGETI